MKSNLRLITETLAAMFARIRLDIRKILPSTYLRGTRNAEDYGELVYTGDLPNIIPQSYKEDLDKIGEMFSVKRYYREKDESYRQRIIFNIKKSTTEAGIEETVKFIFNNSPYFNNINSKYKTSFNVRILENYHNSFDGVSHSLNTPVRGKLTRYYGITIVLTPTSVKDSLGNTPKIMHNYDFSEIVRTSDYSGMRTMLNLIVASGITVDRVIIEQPGAGGNRAEIYDYK